MKTENFLNKIRSGCLETQVSALNEISNFTETLAEESVQALAISQSPIVIAESLFRFGSAVKTTLERKFLSEISGDTKIILAALLVQLGSNVGVEYLIEAVKTRTGYENLAATSLAKAGVKNACPALIEKLDKLEHSFYSKPENAPYILTFLVALDRLGGTLPSYLRERFTTPGMPIDIAHFTLSNRP